MFARYGGEEFVAILPETDENGVQQIAETMRKAIESLEFLHDYSDVASYITISVGAIVQTVDDETPARLLKKVDMALYQAKKQGRNRVVMVST